MAGKKMKLSTEMTAFAREPLHQRTVVNWRESVVGIEDLRERIAKQLLLWLRHQADKMQDVFFAHTNAEAVGFIMQQMDRICFAHGVHRDFRIRFLHSSTFEIDHTRLNEFLELPLSKVSWDSTDGINLMLLLLTYRTFIEEKVTPIPGLPFNITIPGCVYTCFRLGVGVEA